MKYTLNQSNSQPPAINTSNDMDMTAAVFTIEHPCYQNFIFFEGFIANRTISHQPSVNTVNTAPDMHQAVFTAGQGRKRQGLH